MTWVQIPLEAAAFSLKMMYGSTLYIVAVPCPFAMCVYVMYISYVYIVTLLALDGLVLADC